MQAKNFSYKCGNAQTNIPWFPPDPEFLNLWWNEFYKTTDIAGYTFWLCGAVMEEWSTTDIDILVTGKIDNYERLENILLNAMNLGFKYRQLIDIAYNDYYKKFLKKGACERRAICCEHFYKYDWCTPEKCAQKVDDIETIVIGNEVMKNEEIITPADPEAIKLGDSLYKIKMSSPSEKQSKRILDGWIYNSRPLRITPGIDFKNHVPWS